MDKDELKIYLKENPQYIENILENIGCHHIKKSSKRITCALPDGDNFTSISIKLNDNLKTEVYSRKGEFDKYEYKDVFTLIQFINEYSLSEAIQFVCKQCGLKYSNNIKKSEKSSSYSFLRQFKRSLNKINKLDDYDELILDETFTQRFIRETCDLFLQDGINKTTQTKFGVSYDILDNRVVFPIRNDNGELLTFKGRTMDSNYKIKGIPKYFYYYPYVGEFYLYGLYENYFDIISSNEVFIFEAEKSVMQCNDMDINNCVAVSKKVISPVQLTKLLKLGKDIILAFDKDVILDDIFVECKKFKKGLCNVYYIYDDLDLLQGKESVTDKGKEIFMQLYTNCKFKYEG
jgi:DNA primase